MSCNGDFAMRQGLNSIYPFKGIFPWEPWINSINPAVLNLNSKMPVVVAVGSKDDNYNTLLNLYDSLKLHGVNVNLDIVPNIYHTLNFSTFWNEMIRCMRYLNDTGAIEISPIENDTMKDNDTLFKIKAVVRNYSGNSLYIRAVSSNTNIFVNPVIDYTTGNDTVTINITPKKGKTGKVTVIFEAIESGGSGIAQKVFKVYVTPTTQVHKVTTTNSLVVFPNPTHDKIYIHSNETNLSVSITDIVGKQVFGSKYLKNPECIDISYLPKGIYFVSISGKNVRQSVKIQLE
jgi:hypothetical protein